MTLTIVAVVAFFGHVLLWLRLPTSVADSVTTVDMDMVLETATS
jgi:hypothetical protein